MRLIRRILLAALLWPLVVLSSAEAPDSELPAACQQSCVNPYGIVVGTADGDVPAYSNCKTGCVVFEPHYEWDVYTGLKWQCVEYARRWLYVHTGQVFESVDYAADIWQQVSYYKDAGNGNKVPVINYPNGSATRPAAGDLLIYDKALFGTGHVAVVTGVDSKRSIVRVAEQNYKNTRWPDNYSREIIMTHKDGRYRILDEHLLGWKRQK